MKVLSKRTGKRGEGKRSQEKRRGKEICLKHEEKRIESGDNKL